MKPRRPFEEWLRATQSAPGHPFDREARLRDTELWRRFSLRAAQIRRPPEDLLMIFIEWVCTDPPPGFRIEDSDPCDQ